MVTLVRALITIKTRAEILLLLLEVLATWIQIQKRLVLSMSLCSYVAAFVRLYSILIIILIEIATKLIFITYYYYY